VLTYLMKPMQMRAGSSDRSKDDSGQWAILLVPGITARLQQQQQQQDWRVLAATDRPMPGSKCGATGWLMKTFSRPVRPACQLATTGPPALEATIRFRLNSSKILIPCVGVRRASATAAIVKYVAVGHLDDMVSESNLVADTFSRENPSP